MDNELNIELLNKRKSELNLTFDELSKMSNIPKTTLTNIFTGVTKHPRIDTIKSIERALGLHEVPTFDRELSDGEKEILSLISQLSDDEVDELSSFIDYIVSKRK